MSSNSFFNCTFPLKTCSAKRKEYFFNRTLIFNTHPYHHTQYYILFPCNLQLTKRDPNRSVRISYSVRETGLEPASTCVHMNLNHARLPIPPFPQKRVWAGVDSNHRSVTRQIYSLLPLATREPTHIKLVSPFSKENGAGDGTRTRNLLITNQLLCQLSYASTELAFGTSPKGKSGDPEGARTLDLQRDRLAL